jgi:hypothetical protein
MKAGDERAARTASQESWHSAPLTDPNAALWASITPPAHGSLQTLIRRRVASLSVDLLAQRLWLRFPGFFSSRTTAQRSILGAAFALGAGLGVAGFLAMNALTASPTNEAAANMLHALNPQRTAMAQVSAEATGVRTPSQASGARPQAADVRSSERVGAALGGGMTGASTLAASVAPAEPEQAVQALNPSDAVEEPRQAHKARHASASKRKAKARARAKNSASASASRTKSNSRARMLANALGLK